MNALPLVSIGMPLYQSADTVRGSLASLLAQTFAGFELVVSDNASSDGTGAICEQVAAADARVRVLRQQTNRGPVANFAAVLEPARGRYFMWAAGDDSWHPAFLEKCVAALEARPDVGVVFPRAAVVSRRFPFLSRLRLPQMDCIEADDPFERVRGYIALPAASHKANAIYGLWRTELARDTIAAVAGVAPHLVYSGLDIAMMSYALTRMKMLQLPEILFEKRLKWFPAGSLPDDLLSFAIMLLKPERRRQAARAFDEHIELLRMVLDRAGVLDARYEAILREKAESRTP